MMMHKTDAYYEAGGLIGEMTQAGMLLSMVSLAPSSRAEAIEWARRYADVLGEIELDIRPVEGISTFGR